MPAQVGIRKGQEVEPIGGFVQQHFPDVLPMGKKVGHHHFPVVSRGDQVRRSECELAFVEITSRSAKLRATILRQVGNQLADK